MREEVEIFVRDGVQWLRLGIEVMGALVVGLGIVIGWFQFIRILGTRGQSVTFTPIRLVLARYLALALEFQLGADILSTAVAPTWTLIGQLGAIAIIRTALNFFLSREMREEQATTEAEARATRHAEAPPDAGTSRQ